MIGVVFVPTPNRSTCRVLITFKNGCQNLKKSKVDVYSGDLVA